MREGVVRERVVREGVVIEVWLNAGAYQPQRQETGAPGDPHRVRGADRDVL